MKLRSQIIKLRQMLSLVAEHFPNLPAGKCFTDTNDKVKAESKKALNLHLRHILHYIQKSTYYSYSTVLQEIRKKNKKVYIWLKYSSLHWLFLCQFNNSVHDSCIFWKLCQIYNKSVYYKGLIVQPIRHFILKKCHRFGRSFKCIYIYIYIYYRYSILRKLSDIKTN